MTLRIDIRWDNPSSPLIADAVIYLMIDGIGRPPDSEGKGFQQYDLPDTTKTIELHARFTAHLRAVKVGTATIAAQSHQTLRIDQNLEVTDGHVRALSHPEWSGKHPLVLVSSSTAGNAVTKIHLRTRFVDITPLWQAYADSWKYYQAHREPDARLRVLGFTGGAPQIWFASYAKSLERNSFRRPGALVFFRPANYKYTRVDEPHKMGALIRYLTKPKPGTSRHWEEDHQNADPDKYFYIRCGFEAAVVQANRPLVMLHPWPSGSSFGLAQTRKLRGLARDAVRYLWADQHIYREQKVTGFGRLGVAGFSLGGGGVFSSLGLGNDKIDELYLFDCTGSSHSRGIITQWFLSRRKKPGHGGTPCLRMAGGAYNINTYNSIRDAIAAALGKTTLPEVTVTPRDETMYDPGHNPMWEHVIKDTPHYRSDRDQRHQFSVHGGDDPSGPGPYVHTYLLDFLENSRFDVA